tara:strand:+ start:14605 stop:14853 length:249 start_codon:yes stop_codon:yes gene_type:complete
MLIETNAAAIQENRNRSIDVEILQQLDDDFKFPVVFAMEHNQIEMRVKVLIAPDLNVMLDMSFARFNSLPVVEVEVETATLH